MANDSTYTLYNYDPSAVAAIIFVVLFGLTTLVHIFQMIRSRSWFFIPFIIGGLFEAVGYVGRYLNSKETPNWTTAPYIMQSLLLLVAPAFFAASIYMILGRSIVSTGHDSLSVISVKWLTKIFVCGDVVSFFAQCAGGGFLSSAKTQSKITLGQNIIIAGLFIQIAFFGFFVVTAGIFHYRLWKCCGCVSMSSIRVPWQKCFFVLYTASLFIMIRSIFRAIEYITGTDGPLMSTEVYLYIFDAALMFLTMVTFNIFSPKTLCDETRPHCNNCFKHGVQCLFSESAPAGSRQIGSPTPNNSSAPSPVSGENTPLMGMAEMALLHHFSTSTCYTISRNPILQTVWQTRIPQVSFTSPFVFRAIIALSALHLAHVKPEFHEHYVCQAELHHNTALQMVTAILPDVNKENCQSIYLFSILTCIISCAKPRIRHDFWANSDRDIEWLTLFRGTTHILASADVSLKTGLLAPMFAMGHRKKLARDARSATAMPPFLLVLKQLLQDTVQDSSELQCYHDSIDDMAMSFATVNEIGSHNCETADIFIWLLRVSDQYFGYFQQRTPEAMVIFAYFCVVMKEMEWAWWMQGFSVHTISGIYYHLDEEHRCWLQWPMQQVGWVA
ncbi:hypothetical protein N7517_003297 [Penicillium concentricum]|uniref:Zn(2)-C6 fungal-type domain-containing protein n=1 Tax=Penicillium concentricum TaxID=293559 RepID=A0A9W9SVQ6_9EURO|nr:uncharacterized protein N7517_003297 [Penicillium concentricum]KAJ5385386.1 hypothetical protein N7517_003297 [Penicillium concentricum]